MSHTGWRKIGERWTYLYQGGAVGAPEVEVKLDPAYERFTLPSAAEDPKEAVRLSLDLLACGKPSITVPLLAAVYTAPLASILNPDFAVWLVGTTGSLKSELAALAQRHFGLFDRKTLPGSWSSTANAIEAQLFTTKDMLSVVDDYAPQSDAVAQKEQTKRAEIVLRNIGNHTGRARLRADLSHRPVRPPRGLCMCTGEDHPPTRSIVARLVLVNVDRDKLHLPTITRLQRDGERLRHAMRAYIEWLAPQMSTLETTLRREQAEIIARDFAARELGPHLRGSSGVTALYQGLDLFLTFATELGVITEGQAREHLQVAIEVLKQIARSQGEVLREADPVDRFMQILRTLLGQGKIYLRDRDGVRALGAATAEEMLGWRDEEWGYVLPDAARRVVGTFMRDVGEGWEGAPARLYEGMVKRKVVKPGPNGKPYTQLRFEGERRRVLVIPLSALVADEEPAVTADVPPEKRTGDGSGDGGEGNNPEESSEDRENEEEPSQESQGFEGGEEGGDV